MEFFVSFTDKSATTPTYKNDPKPDHLGILQNNIHFGVCVLLKRIFMSGFSITNTMYVGLSHKVLSISKTLVTHPWKAINGGLINAALCTRSSKYGRNGPESTNPRMPPSCTSLFQCTDNLPPNFSLTVLTNVT